ncbi:hypothetical protein WEU32_06910 [Brevundimonas sp. BH3]|uniref:hypothetical protein n=1 Tax=Brevundimonas sp. BH3 TaxID=3133089 RepID=UPI00324D33B9
MANSTPNNPLFSASGTAGNTDLALELFTGEVLQSFHAKTNFRDKQRFYALSKGKSLQLPVIGTATASYHTAGVELVGGTIGADDVTIYSDDKLVSDIFLSDIQEMLTHFDTRAPYTRELAHALARAYDKNSFTAIVNAARANAPLGGGNSTPVVEAAALTDATKLFAALSKAKLEMEKKNVDVDSEEVFACLPLASWYLLANSDRNLNKDYNGGRSDISRSMLDTIDGIKVMKSNIAPFATDLSAETTIPTRYRQDMTKTAGAVWTRDAIATVEVQAMGVQTEEQIRKQGHLIVARHTAGVNVVRPQCAVEIRTAV